MELGEELGQEPQVELGEKLGQEPQVELGEELGQEPQVELGEILGQELQEQPGEELQHQPGEEMVEVLHKSITYQLDLIQPQQETIGIEALIRSEALLMWE